MRILFDLLHPAHVHVFKNVIWVLQERGDEVVVTSRSKDVTTDLLDAYGIDHTVLSVQGHGSVQLLTEWAQRSWRLRTVITSFEPDVLVGVMGVSIAPAGRVTGTPSLVFYDTEVATYSNKIVYPLATAVITPDCYAGPRRANQVTYAGYHELAYLHPNRFTPDRSRLEAFGISAERFSLLRFVGQDSSHDQREVALSDDAKVDVVQSLERRGPVVISSEHTLPERIADRRLTGPVEDVHQVIAHASVVIGESATMAAEAAVLGTPSVFIGQTSRGYVDDLAESYSLIDRFVPADIEKATARAYAYLAEGADRGRGERRLAMLEDKVDLTSWITDYIDRFGERRA